MPDTTHWIVVRDIESPREITNEALAVTLAAYGECIHLVPTRVWRDYQEMQKKLARARDELRTYRRATMVPQAALDGFPMPKYGDG